MTQIIVTQDEITFLPFDAIVCPHSPGAMRVPGLTEKIIAAAGSALAPRVPLGVGDVLVTSGYGLPARLVIHRTVPRPAPGMPAASTELLSTFHSNCIAAAAQHAVRSLVFPVVGAGVRGWPFPLAAGAAMEPVSDWISDGRARPGHIVVAGAGAAAGLYRRLARDRGLRLVEHDIIGSAGR